MGATSRAGGRPGTPGRLGRDRARSLRSADQAASWNSVSGIPSAVTALDVDSHGGFFAATAGDGLFASNDGGASMGTDEARGRVSDGRGRGLRGRVVLPLSPDGVFSPPMAATPGGSRASVRSRRSRPGGSGSWAARRSSRSPPSRACLQELDTFQQRTHRDVGVFFSRSSRLAWIGPRGNSARDLLLSDTGDGWKRLSGAPRRVEFYAIMLKTLEAL